MSEQALDLRRSLKIVRRHKIARRHRRPAWPLRGRRLCRPQLADARKQRAGGAAPIAARYIRPRLWSQVVTQ